VSARGLVLLALVAGSSGCAYYNGMYNAKRFAGQAERSERAGRTAEAADRWRQVLLHADTVMARHPHSRWADDAALLKGRALIALSDFTDAVPALEQAKATAGEEEQGRSAQYWLGVAYGGRRDYPAALANFDSALASSRADYRRRVRLSRGRMLLAMGRPAEAQRDFDAVSTDAARFDRAVASLTLGESARAAAQADSAVGAREVSAERWQVFLDSLGRRAGSAEASRLVDHLVASGRMSTGWKARLLLADGDRLAAAGLDSAAMASWSRTQHLAPDSVAGAIATVRGLRLTLRAPDASSFVGPVRDRLAAIAASAGGEAGREANEVLRLLGARDSLARVGGAPDARAYQAAEWLRDSLPSPSLAAEAFAAMATEWPESPWAPKALVAALEAGHPEADSLRRVLESRYGESPYVLALDGGAVDAAAYAAAEDSLATELEVSTAQSERAVGEPGDDANTDDAAIAARRAASRARSRASAAPPPQAARALPHASTLPRDPEP